MATSRGGIRERADGCDDYQEEGRMVNNKKVRKGGKWQKGRRREGEQWEGRRRVVGKIFRNIISMGSYMGKTISDSKHSHY